MSTLYVTQVLFLGFGPDDPRLERLRHLAGASLVLSEPEELSKLRLADWDALVLEGIPVPYQASAIHILAFHSASLGQPLGRWSNIVPTGKQPSRTLHIAEDISPELRRLVTAETIPWLDAQDAVPYLQSGPIGTHGPSSPHDLDSENTADWVAVLSDADGNVVLGAFPRERGDKWCWTIPHRSNTPELWLTVAMATWRAANPESFPWIDPWRVREPWMTNAERDARAELEQLREEHRRAEEAFRQRELQLNAALTVAAQASREE